MERPNKAVLQGLEIKGHRRTKKQLEENIK